MLSLLKLDDGTIVSFTYRYDFEIKKNERPSEDAGGAKYHQVPGTDIVYCTIPGSGDKPERLKLYSKEIYFSAGIYLDEPNGKLAEWQAVLNQTIYRSQRNGHFEGGIVRELRLDTSFGPLSDGGGICYDKPKSFVGNKVELETSDGPNWPCPTLYKGKKLMATSGRDEFRTFLILAQKRDRSIIVLASVDWEINWAGTYIPDRTPPWLPVDADTFVTAEKHLMREFYFNLKAKPQITPLSTMNCTAESFCQINEDGWKGCNVAGDTRKAAFTYLGKWTDGDDY